MGMLGNFVHNSGDADAVALITLREVLVRADELGVVQRDRLPDSADAGIGRLRAYGIVDTIRGEPPEDAENASEISERAIATVRLSPAALADLMEMEIEDGREPLIRSIDGRLAQLADGNGAAAGVASPEPEPSPGHPTVDDRSPGANDDAFRIVPTGWEALEVPDPLTDGAAEDPAATASDEIDPETPAAPFVGGITLGSRGLVKSYRKRRVVNEVDLHLRQGEIVGLLGPNGAGKTTTFYMVVGLIKPDRGKVFLADEDVTDVPMYRRARRGIGYLAQEPSIFRKLTVEENILAVLQMLGLRRREQKERLERLLDELGIKHLRHAKAYALSGGERRRLEITRALVGEPKFMLLDEPFAGVDPIAVHDIQQIVADLRRRGIGVLISDHNVEQTLDIVDRAYIMYDGKVRVSGTVSELVWNDEVAEIYLGPTLTARMRQRYGPPN